MNKALVLQRLKRDAVDIYKAAIDGVNPEILMRETISVDLNDQILKIKQSSDSSNFFNIDLNKSRFHVFGGGKCVVPMACGLAKVMLEAGLGNQFGRGILSVPEAFRESLSAHQSDLLKSIGVRCAFGAKNNLPDESSQKATEEILVQARTVCEEAVERGEIAVILTLISGGGSACLCSPRHIKLDQKLDLIRRLVQKGADIRELNSVRGYFSNMKSGGFVHNIEKNSKKRPGLILGLIMSDIVGDPLEFIGGAPTFIAANDRFESMLEVLNKYNIPVPDHQRQLGHSECTKISSKLENLIIANNRRALAAAADKAQQLGYEIVARQAHLQGPSQDLVQIMLDRAGPHAANSARTASIFGGEATIVRRDGETWGKGGRAQEMALDYLIASGGPPNPTLVDVFLAAGSDGQDGPTDAAGCIASLAEWAQDPKIFSADDLIMAKTTHNSYDFWTQHKPDWLVKTGMTGTNVMDIYLILIQHV